MSINSNSKIFNSRTIEFYSMERGGGETREDRCSGETKTPAIISYPFTRNLSPFHTERAFTVKPQQTFIPERQYDRHFKDSALQRTIQHLFNFRYLHDFALCSSADTFLYSDNALSLSHTHIFFPSPGMGRNRRRMKHPFAISFVHLFERSRYVANNMFDAWKIIKDAPLRFITFWNLFFVSFFSPRILPNQRII